MSAFPELATSLPTDIRRKVQTDYPDDCQAEAVLGQYQGLERPRVMRCILHLARGDSERLLHYVGVAVSDYRDVIFWAEYNDGEHRVHDFNHPFVA